jgi:tRNA (mo5U34)-methyltransferase
VIANEGFPGLIRHIAHRLITLNPRGDLSDFAGLSRSLDEYRRLATDFRDKTLSLGDGNLCNYWWYHTVDLGNGLVTPGCYDYRQSLREFKFPDDMAGMSVLDVGSATGFFAFEFEKRGACVTSVEIPSFDQWDRFPGETLRQTIDKFVRDLEDLERFVPLVERRSPFSKTFTPEEAYYYSLDGPFKFCHEALKSKVHRCYSTVYDLSAEKLGKEGFDLVFMGDVLAHTLYPLKALATAAGLCRGRIVIAQRVPGAPDPQAAMLYIGGDKLGEDSGAWWEPNRMCFEQILRKLGFREVSLVGEYDGFMMPYGRPYRRQVIHAVR